jgi:hypothetical protein
MVRIWGLHLRFFKDQDSGFRVRIQGQDSGSGSRLEFVFRFCFEGGSGGGRREWIKGSFKYFILQ